MHNPDMDVQQDNENNVELTGERLFAQIYFLWQLQVFFGTPSKRSSPVTLC